MIGDKLAAGGTSAVFPASDGKVSQQRWDEIFADWEPKESAIKEKSTTPDLRWHDYTVHHGHKE
jgi:hypothetical protein